MPKLQTGWEKTGGKPILKRPKLQTGWGKPGVSKKIFKNVKSFKEMLQTGWENRVGKLNRVGKNRVFGDFENAKTPNRVGKNRVFGDFGFQPGG